MRGREIAILVGAVALGVLLLGLLPLGMMMRMMGMMGPGMMGWGGFAFPLMWLLMLLFWALLVGGGVWPAGRIFRPSRPAEAGPGAGGDRALEILRERYARGEISREEYQRVRDDLTGDEIHVI